MMVSAADEARDPATLRLKLRAVVAPVAVMAIAACPTFCAFEWALESRWGWFAFVGELAAFGVLSLFEWFSVAYLWLDAKLVQERSGLPFAVLTELGNGLMAGAGALTFSLIPAALSVGLFFCLMAQDMPWIGCASLASVPAVGVFVLSASRAFRARLDRVPVARS